MWTLGIVVYDGIDASGLFGPLDVWATANQVAHRLRPQFGRVFDVRLLTSHPDLTVESREGKQVDGDLPLTAASGLDLVWVPGGDITRLLGDAGVRAELARLRDRAEMMVGVGSGCVPLLEAGLLTGVINVERAVLAELARLGSHVEIDEDATYVDQGHLVTAPNDAAVDTALHVVSRLEGMSLGAEVAHHLCHDWRPHAGRVVPPRSGDGLF